MCGALAWDPPRGSAAAIAKYATMKPSDTQTQSASAVVAADGNNDSIGTFTVNNITWMSNSTAEAQA